MGPLPVRVLFWFYVEQISNTFDVPDTGQLSTTILRVETPVMLPLLDYLKILDIMKYSVYKSYIYVHASSARILSMIPPVATYPSNILKGYLRRIIYNSYCSCCARWLDVVYVRTDLSVDICAPYTWNGECLDRQDILDNVEAYLESGTQRRWLIMIWYRHFRPTPMRGAESARRTENWKSNSYSRKSKRREHEQEKRLITVRSDW